MTMKRIKIPIEIEIELPEEEVSKYINEESGGTIQPSFVADLFEDNVVEQLLYGCPENNVISISGYTPEEARKSLVIDEPF